MGNVAGTVMIEACVTYSNVNTVRLVNHFLENGEIPERQHVYREKCRHVDSIAVFQT